MPTRCSIPAPTTGVPASRWRSTSSACATGSSTACPAEALTRITQSLTTEPREWPWLEPPTSYAMTAIDVLAARDGEEHLRLVREWAASAWEAWSTHHEAGPAQLARAAEALPVTSCATDR